MSLVKWEPFQDAILIAAVTDSSPNKLIARQLGRTKEAVEARIAFLRKAGKLPPAKIGRRPLAGSLKAKQAKAATQTALPGDLWASADLAHAIFTVGQFLPEGMQVTFYRPPNAPESTAIEVTHPDGEKSRHWVGQIAH